MKSKFLILLTLILSVNLHAITLPQCPEDINKEFRQRILEVIENDKEGILGLQFHITTLKMAIKSKAAGHRTLEAYVRRKENILEQSEITKEMVEVYKEFGIAKDLGEIKKLTETKDAKYNRGSTRLYNGNVSAYILGKHLSGDKSYNMRDAAILSVANLISDDAKRFGNYSAQRNLSNLSNRVAMYNGYVNPSKSMPIDALKEKLKTLETMMGNIFTNIKKDFSDHYAHCLVRYKADGTCEAHDLDEIVDKEFLNVLKELATKSTSAELKKTNMGELVLNGKKATIDFGRYHKNIPPLKPVPSPTPVPTPTPTPAPTEVSDNFACNGVPKSYRKQKNDKEEKAKGLIADCLMNAVMSGVEGLLLDAVDMKFSHASSLTVNSFHNSKEKKDYEYDDDIKKPISRSKKEIINDNVEKSMEMAKTYSEAKLKSMGLKKIDGIISIEDRNKYIDKYFDTTLRDNYTVSQRAKIERNLGQLFEDGNREEKEKGPSQFNSNNSSLIAPQKMIGTSSLTARCVFMPIQCAKEAVTNLMDKVEKDYLPGIFTMKCWKLGPVVNQVCSVIGKAIGRTVTTVGLTALISVPTGGAALATLPATIGSQLVKAATDEGPELMIDIGIHAAFRMGSHMIAKGRPVLSPKFKDDREHIFNELDNFFEPAKRKALVNIMSTDMLTTAGRFKTAIDTTSMLVKDSYNNAGEFKISEFKNVFGNFFSPGSLNTNLVCQKSTLVCGD